MNITHCENLFHLYLLSDISSVRRIYLLSSILNFSGFTSARKYKSTWVFEIKQNTIILEFYDGTSDTGQLK